MTHKSNNERGGQKFPERIDLFQFCLVISFNLSIDSSFFFLRLLNLAGCRFKVIIILRMLIFSDMLGVTVPNPSTLKEREHNSYLFDDVQFIHYQFYRSGGKLEGGQRGNRHDCFLKWKKSPCNGLTHKGARGALASTNVFKFNTPLRSQSQHSAVTWRTFNSKYVNLIYFQSKIIYIQSKVMLRHSLH